MARRVSSPRMVGRSVAMTALEGAFASAVEGVPRITVVAGEAGIGKSRLAREFAARARAADARVLWGECVSLQAGELPYAPIVAALRDDGWPAELANVSVQRGAQSAGAPRVFESALSTLGRVTALAPAVVVLEDVHWADSATQDLLQYLARNLREERLLLVLTLRTDEPGVAPPVRRLLGELARSDLTERVQLERLRPEDTATQVADIAGEARAALARSLHERAEGNPYFVEELLAASEAEGGSSELPASLREVLIARIAGLPLASRQVLDVVATAGRDIDHDLLRGASTLTDEALADAIHSLVEAQQLVCDRGSERYTFRHALSREAVYGELLPADRRMLHSRVASALATLIPEERRTAADWAALAQHHDAAHEVSAALHTSVAAATAATEVHAYQAARLHLDRARLLWPQVAAAERPVDIDEIELLFRLAGTARLAGDRDGAIPTAQAALGMLDEAAEPGRAAALHALLGLLHKSRPRALAHLDRALALLPSQPSRERAAVLVLRCFKSRYGASYRRTRDRSLEALAVARTAGARAEEGRALAMLGYAEAYGGNADEAVAHLREAIEIARELDRGDDLTDALNSLGDALMMLGNVEEARQTMEAGFEDVRRAGLARSDGLNIEVNLADCELRLGDWNAAETRLVGLLDSAGLDGDFRVLLSSYLIMLLARRGELDRAAELAAETSTLFASNVGPASLVMASTARAELALLREDPGAARLIVDETRRTLGSGDLLCWPALLTLGIRAEADLAERARAAGEDDSDARSHAARILGSPDTPGSLRSYTFEESVGEPAPPETQLHWALGEAELARAAGNHRGTLWAAIAQRWEQLRFPYPFAYARLREAEARLAAGGDRPGAADALRAAHATLARLGAATLREKTEALARHARISLPPAQGSEQPERPFDLTARELTVLEHIAAGHTNRGIAERLYLSPRTVDVHVRHILAKLDAANRVEAATIAQRHGLAR